MLKWRISREKREADPQWFVLRQVRPRTIGDPNPPLSIFNPRPLRVKSSKANTSCKNGESIQIDSVI
jgi:hypothetical protein